MQLNKKALYITVILAILSIVASPSKASDSTQLSYRITAGLAVGTDIGGAVPYPLSNIPSPFNAYPQLKPSIGGRVAMSLENGWSVGAEVTYKNIGMKADARVKNQKFNMNGTDVYFTGSAKMNMNFVILEIPLYAKYQFRKGNDNVLAGIYYSHTFSSSFEASPQKGFIGPVPDLVEIMDVSDVTMNFNDDLDKWDMGFLIGYERKIIDRLNIGLRFSMGFKDIFKPSSGYFEYKMLPMRGSITLSYDLAKTKQLFGLKTDK